MEGESDRPASLGLQVAEVFADAQASYTTERHEYRSCAVAGIEQDERDRKAELERKRRRRQRQMDLRSRNRILADLLDVDGVELVQCACGCGRLFQREPGPGRPQKYATTACKWRAVKRAVKEAIGGRGDPTPPCA